MDYDLQILAVLILAGPAVLTTGYILLFHTFFGDDVSFLKKPAFWLGFWGTIVAGAALFQQNEYLTYVAILLLVAFDIVLAVCGIRWLLADRKVIKR